LASRRAPLPPRQAYARWAPRYPASAHNPLMHAEQSVMAPIIAAIAATRALDVGTGSGRYLPMLHKTGAHLVVGLDFSLPMLSRADRTCAARVCGDAHALPFAAGSFDLVSAALMLGDVAKLGPWLAEMSRVLVAGGHLVYSDFHPAWTARGWRRTFH